MVTTFAALAIQGQGAMATFEAERLDVGTERFGDSQPVDSQQRDKRVLARRRQSRRDEQRTDVVAVQTGGVGLVVKARAPNMNRWRPVARRTPNRRRWCSWHQAMNWRRSRA
jgi:hypothetical protein